MNQRWHRVLALMGLMFALGIEASAAATIDRTGNGDGTTTSEHWTINAQLDSHGQYYSIALFVAGTLLVAGTFLSRGVRRQRNTGNANGDLGAHVSNRRLGRVSVTATFEILGLILGVLLILAGCLLPMVGAVVTATI